MKTIVIAGGNSGIGLQAGREFLAAGHRVILLGRDHRKGEAAIASFGAVRERATFFSVDLSTHDGVRDAAVRITRHAEQIDSLIHSAAVFETKDVRTLDDIPVFPALSYFSRYHLTQLLLPQLLRTAHPRVIMLTAALKTVPPLDPHRFPRFANFHFRKDLLAVNGASLYYADHLMKTHPTMFAGCVTPGLVRTGIFREAPLTVRLLVVLLGPLMANSVAKAASNVVKATLSGDEGASALFWPKPGSFDETFIIETDADVRNALIEASRKETGA